MRRIAIPLIALTAVACGGSDNSGPTEAPLNITANGIASNANRSDIQIPVGGKVHYFNKDTAPHTIVGAGSGGCEVLSSNGAIPPGGNDPRPAMTQTANCTLSDSANPALAASVAVIAAPAGGSGGGGGSGY